MPTYFQRPENALKRANEFIDVGKKQVRNGARQGRKKRVKRKKRAGPGRRKRRRRKRIRKSRYEEREQGEEREAICRCVLA